MAHHKQAKKRIRQTEARTEVNRARRGRVRSFIKKVETAITAGNKDEAATALRVAESEMMRAAGKGIYKKPTASRKISRLSQRIKSLAA